MRVLISLFFFFQAEDGIRDLTVTGVQTCALPISPGPPAIWVSGGVLSTMMTRVVVAEFPARSVAAAPSVCEPSLTVDVSQGAVAVPPGAGRGGSAGVVRGPSPTGIPAAPAPARPSRPIY